MKFGIIGDIHIGIAQNLGKIDSITGINSRIIDFSNTLNGIIDGFLKHKVETIILLGDIFDSRHPSSVQLDLFSKSIERILSNDIKVFIITGNHDIQKISSATSLDLFSSLKLPNISIYSEMSVHTIPGEPNINLVFLPFIERKMLGVTNNGEAVVKIQNKLHTLVKDLTGLKLAFGHLMLDNPVIGYDAENFSLSEIILPSKIFKNFNSVIFGHIHKHQVLRKNNPFIAYAGSIDACSFGEHNHQKVSIILDTNNINKPEIIKTKIRPLCQIDLDYSKQSFKENITKKIVLDIKKFDKQYCLNNSIVKLIVKIKQDDVCHVNQKIIKEFILSKNVKYLVPIQISALNTRKLRDRNITENIDSKKAMESFIRGLTTPDSIKRKLIKTANSIIKDIDGR